MTFQFDLDTASQRNADNEFSSEVSDRWDIMTFPNGGYLLAMAGKAVGSASKLEPFSMTAHFLSPATPGPAKISTEAFKTGRRLQHWQASMSQEGNERLRILAAMGDFDQRDGVTYDQNPCPPAPNFSSCVKLPFPFRFFEQVDLRLNPNCTDWLQGNSHKQCQLEGWLSFQDGKSVDVWTLLLMADSFPPPAFRHFGTTGWVPTIELNVQIRRRPAPGPIYARFSSRSIIDGYLETDSELWDCNGELVALGRQLALLRMKQQPAQ